MRFAAFFLLMGLLGCGSPSPFEIDARDPASAEFHPPSPGALKATLQEDGTVRLVWDDRSSYEEGFVIERRTWSEADFSELAVLTGGTTTYTDTPPATFAATYRIASFAERGGARQRSEESNQAQVVFFDPDAFAPTLNLLDERALHVGFSNPLPASATLHVQRYAEGQPDGPLREVTGPLSNVPLGTWPERRAYVFADSLALREISYRYEVSVSMGADRSSVHTTQDLQVKLGWAVERPVYLNAFLANPGLNSTHYVLQIICQKVPLGTLYTFSIIDDLGSVVSSWTLNQQNRPVPQALAQPLRYFPDIGSAFDPARRYRLHVRLSSGAEAVSNELYYSNGWRTS